MAWKYFLIMRDSYHFHENILPIIKDETVISSEITYVCKLLCFVIERNFHDEY